MTFFKCCLVLGIGCLTIGFGAVSAQDVGKEEGAVPKASAIQGTWSWEHKTGTKTADCELSITEKDGTLHCVLNAGKKKYESKTGKLNEGVFSVSFPVKNGDKKYAFKGKLSKGKMTGEYFVPSSGDKSIKWLANRTMSLKEATGRWQLYFETPDGQVQEPVFELFSTKGEPNVEFTEGGPEMDISKTTFKRGVLNVFADIEFQGQEIALEYELEFKKNDVDGLIYFELKATGDQGEIEVEGERLK